MKLNENWQFILLWNHLIFSKEKWYTHNMISKAEKCSQLNKNYDLWDIIQLLKDHLSLLLLVIHHYSFICSKHIRHTEFPPAYQSCKCLYLKLHLNFYQNYMPQVNVFYKEKHFIMFFFPLNSCQHHANSTQYGKLLWK